MSAEPNRRYHGRISEWSDQKRCGFVVPRGSNPSDPVVFLSANAFRSREKTPEIGDIVIYELLPEETSPKAQFYRTKLRATAVTFLGEERLDDIETAPVLSVRVFALTFVISLITASLFFRPARYALLAVLTLSLIAMLDYWWDKNASLRGGRRTPERQLHLIAMLGGWPGAAIAQKLFRHKTQKPSFQRTFKEVAIINVAATALFIWAAYHFNF